MAFPYTGLRPMAFGVRTTASLNPNKYKKPRVEPTTGECRPAEMASMSNERTNANPSHILEISKNEEGGTNVETRKRHVCPVLNKERKTRRSS